MKLFNDKNFNAIEQALTMKFQRHAVLTGNVANANTPRYRSRDVDFGNELERIYAQKDDGFKKTHPNHMDVSGSGDSRIIYDNSGAVRADGNNVDIDQAMGKLSANARSYESMATLLSMKLRVFRQIARGGGGV
jgi:flagellar basal-body rod protein FlgB